MMPEDVGREAEIAEAEHELYPPRPEVVQAAHIQDWAALAKRANEDLVGFWDERASRRRSMKHGSSGE